MKNENINLRIETVAKHKEMYFLTFFKLNALFLYNPTSKRLTYLHSFEAEQINSHMYTRSFLHKDEIWFLPAEAQKVSILNTNNMHMDYLTIDSDSKHNISETKYNNFLRFNNKYVCFVPRSAKEAVIINLETREVEKSYRISRQNEEYQNVILIDNILHFYPWHGDYKASLDLTSGKLSYEKWKGNESFGDAVYDKVSGKIFHAPARKKYVLIDDIDGKIIDKKILNLPVNNVGYYTFYSSSYDDEMTFWGTKGFISINSKIDDTHYTQIREDSDGLILIPIDFSSKEAFVFGGNEIFKYDLVQKKYISFKITITFKELIIQLRQAKKGFNELYNFIEHTCEVENDPLTLNEYIYLIGSDL